jgi:Insertion element 4 transposase N-terminal/Transposase DDE domain
MTFMVAEPSLPALTDLPVLSVVDPALPHATVQTVLHRYQSGRERCRKLPGELLVLLVVAMHLVPSTSLDLVLETMLAGLRQAYPGRLFPASASGISHARYRWGSRPLRDLFRRCCVPIATPTTQGAWLFGWRTVALDGSYEDVADTVANARAFGRRRSQFGPSAFPQVLGMYLVECGTHAIIAAGIWPCRTAVRRAAHRLVSTITADMLVLWDSGLHGYPLTSAIRQTGAHILARVPRQQTFIPLRALSDGTLLAHFAAAPPSRRNSRTPLLLVRVLTYTITDPARPGAGQVHRLMTSLLDPVQYPAQELIAAYHERWEIELTFDELDTHQRLLPGPLRSKKPVGVVQEFYGFLLAHYAVRVVMHEAAGAAQLDPDRLSFTHALRLITLVLPFMVVASPEQRAARYCQLLTDIAHYRLPARQPRQAPRARKRPWAKHRLRYRGTAYAVIRVKPFPAAVQLLDPLTHDAITAA